MRKNSVLVGLMALFVSTTVWAQGQTMVSADRSAALPKGVTRLSEEEKMALSRRIPAAKRSAMARPEDATDAGLVYPQAAVVCWVKGGVICANTQDIPGAQILTRLVTDGYPQSQELDLEAIGYSDMSVGNSVQLWQGSLDSLPGPVTFEVFVVAGGQTTLTSVTINGRQVTGGPLSAVDGARGSNPSMTCASGQQPCSLQVPFLPLTNGPIKFVSGIISDGNFVPFAVAQTGPSNPTVQGPMPIGIQASNGEAIWVICAASTCSQRTVYLSLPLSVPEPKG